MKEILNFDEKEFIPLPKQPLKIEPKIRRFRRKAPRTPEKDTPITPIRGTIYLKAS